MFRTIIIALLLTLGANLASANNVIPTKTELSSNEIKWLDKHRSEEITGIHNKFVWYRASNGYTWSVSINEFKKTGEKDVIVFMNEIINKRLDEERVSLLETLNKGRTLVVLLAQSGMSFEQASIIASAMYEGYTPTANGAVMVSKKYKDFIVQ